MSKIIITGFVAIALAIAITLNTIAIAAAAPKTTPDGKTYTDLVRLCGQEWRASDARKNASKGTGRIEWNKFRAECVSRHGWVVSKPRNAS